MSYIGNIPGENFISFAKQNFTIVNSQTAYTLDFAVADENEIRLVINNVVQEPGSGKAYTASNTTLTLSSALTNGTDEMYCVFLGKARETVTVPTITKDKVNFISDSSSSGVISKGDGSVDGSISLNCSQNSHFTKLSSAAHGAYSGNLNFVLPSSHGSSGQFLKTDGSGNLSFAAAGGITMAQQWRLSSNFTCNGNDQTITGWEAADQTGSVNIGSAMTESSGVFTFPQTGIYEITQTIVFGSSDYNDTNVSVVMQLSTNSGGAYTNQSLLWIGYESGSGNPPSRQTSNQSILMDVTDVSTDRFRTRGSNGDSTNAF